MILRIDGHFFAANCWTVDLSENKTLEHYGRKTSFYASMQTGGAFSSTLELVSALLLVFVILDQNS